MLLMLEPQETKFSPMVVKHPFTDSGIVGLSTKSGGTSAGDILQNEIDRQAWRTEISNQINQAESPHEIYYMITKSYCLAFLKYAAPYLSKEDFSGILAQAWIRTECPNRDPNLGKRDLISMFQSSDPAFLMDVEEYAQFQALEDTVTVYRGVTSYNADNIKALSWTLRQETAEWFAGRFDEDGTVYEAQIGKEHIYALFNGRNEAEVIVDPGYLTDITKIQEMDSGFIMMQ